MVKYFQRIFLVLFILIGGQAQAQENLIPLDSTAFLDFVILQNEVPGLSYRFQVEQEMLSDTLWADSLYRFSKTDSGYFSTQFSEFGLVDNLTIPLLRDRCVVKSLM
jgi:hypothetical protein